MIPILVVQFISLICWYTVPAMAAVPAWLIFLPLDLLAVAVTISVILTIVGWRFGERWFERESAKMDSQFDDDVRRIRRGARRHQFRKD